MQATKTQLIDQQDTSKSIVLSTLNARYIHSAFGLRYLKANLGDLQSQCVIEEFTLESRPEDIVEKLLEHQPKIVGFGIYIWNVVETVRVVSLLRVVAPEVLIVLGGPEVSYELEDQEIVNYADFVITGWGDVSFAELAQRLLAGEHSTVANQPFELIEGEKSKLDLIQMPYALYGEDDIKNRVLYVEASRGCPFKCEFCLSALDKTAWPFDLDKFLSEMGDLYQRGARHFKFVDRTFNLKVANSLRILQFFLDRMDNHLFLHFEVIPDHLPESLKEMIAKFPAGSLQFEIGIQTFNSEVQQRISRRQDNQKAKENISWICNNTNAHVHADLIFGLPGETLQEFGSSFNQLYALAPNEIQVGILKRLRGSPIIRHSETHRLEFNPNPPYAIVSSDCIDYQSVQKVNRFARYWDLIGNSGRFSNTIKWLMDEVEKAPFDIFMVISVGIYERTGQTHKISLLRLYDIVFDISCAELGQNALHMQSVIGKDFSRSGLKSTPKCLISAERKSKVDNYAMSQKKRHNTRQTRH